MEQIVQRFLRWSGKSKSLIFYSYGFGEIEGFLNFQKSIKKLYFLILEQIVQRFLKGDFFSVKGQ